MHAAIESPTPSMVLEAPGLATKLRLESSSNSLWVPRCVRVMIERGYRDEATVLSWEKQEGQGGGGGREAKQECQTDDWGC